MFFKLYFSSHPAFGDCMLDIMFGWYLWWAANVSRRSNVNCEIVFPYGKSGECLCLAAGNLNSQKEVSQNLGRLIKSDKNMNMELATTFIETHIGNLFFSVECSHYMIESSFFNGISRSMITGNGNLNHSSVINTINDTPANQLFGWQRCA